MKKRQGRILIADDNTTSRLTLASAVDQQGHIVTTVENGQQILEKLQTEAFDLILLDIMMPVMNGYEALAALKKHPDWRDIPIIVVSAVEDMESIVKCIELGAEEHLPKLFNPILLRARINACLEKKWLHDKEKQYLRQVDQLTQAVAAMEQELSETTELAELARLSSPVGKLAHVFQKMAREVYARQARLKEDNSVKTAFIDVVTHELRSPFVAATLSTQLISRYAENKMFDELQRQIQQLEAELSEGRQTVDTLISFATQVSANPTIHRERVNFAAFIERVTLPLQNMAERRRVTLTYNLSPTLAEVFIDQERMKEAVYHLVHNGIKFNHEDGSVQILSHVANAQLVFRVRNTGAVIPPKRLAAIWKPFTQNTDRLQRGIEGLGLGLTLVKHAVEAHGGTVAATSDPDEGNTFGFRIPVQPPEKEQVLR